MGKHTHRVRIPTVKKVVPQSIDKTYGSWSSSDSETWIHVGKGLGYPCKVFTDPTSTNSEQEDKENDPPNNLQTTVTLNNLNIADVTEPQEDPISSGMSRKFW